MRDEAREAVACYYCGSRLSAAKPGRLDECANCGRYIHVCRMCAFYDPNETSKQCTEDDAEEVRDKLAANFCDYFRLAADAHDAADMRADTAARAELAALFGESEANQDTEQLTNESRLVRDAEALFRK